ncbi:uncharacterized protein LOC128204072 isoform X1 [Mya arenaria]|uniref:uncharacterized protein LOC128204072 isoform X1 n=1 Tax=Mya arenaria TaxID=6604 RepID=UPI0022E43580|nr:uncharacterized protein LOC128204072 isoform X1 [Mya arenaria]
MDKVLSHVRQLKRYLLKKTDNTSQRTPENNNHIVTSGSYSEMRIKLLVDSLFVQISFGLVGIANWCHVIGFFSQFWHFGPLVTSEISGFVIRGYSGLWKGCEETGTLCFRPDGGSWLKATQAFETLGFIAAVAALILIVLYVFVPATSGKRIVFILSMVACFIAAGCILLGIIIYGTKMDYNLSWSFALCCIAGIIFAVAGLLLAIDFCKR